jgi:hypothetical protein
VLLLAACAADVSEGDLGVGSLEQPSICGGGAASWKNVERSSVHLASSSAASATRAW